jgi:hypothetical protein
MSEYELDMAIKIRHCANKFEITGNYLFLNELQKLIKILLNEKNTTRTEGGDVE